MNKFLVVVFPDEKKAYEGIHALHELHDDGSITVWGTAVVQRGPDGSLEVKQRNDDGGPRAIGLGALLGGLVGFFGGPVGAVVGVAAGTVAGGSAELLNLHVSREFVDSLKLEFAPGDCAVFAEISEEWIAPLDVRMEALGGKVLREPTTEFVGHLLEKWSAARKAELAERKSELAQRKSERAGTKAVKMETNLKSEIERTKKRLRRTLDETQEQLDGTRSELKARMAGLENQAAKAPPEMRRSIEMRAAELRKDLEERQAKLENAYNLIWQAINA